MNDNILTTGYKKFTAAFIGLVIGLVYGLVLSFIGANLFVFLREAVYQKSIAITYAYVNPGIISALLHSIIGTALFSPIFGNISNRKTRVTIGVFIGVIAGVELGLSYIFLESANIFGHFLFISLIAILGGVGGFMVSFTNKKWLDKYVNNSRRLEIKLDSNNAGIWSAIIGGAFAIIVCLISLSSVWNKKEQEDLYIVVYSSKDLTEAKSYATTKIYKDYSPEIYFTSNGFYAVTIGCYNPEKAQHIKNNAIRNGYVDEKAFLIGSKGIVKKIFP